MDKDYILEQVRRCAEENGGEPLGQVRFSKKTGIQKSDWQSHWPRFTDLQVEAGYAPNRPTPPIPKEQLLEKLVVFISELGRFPSNNDLRFKAKQTEDFPSESTFRSRLGVKKEIVREILDYCGERDKFADVARICEDVIANESSSTKNSNQRDGPPDSIEFGSVYLMKSGRFYKIGTSKHVGRRHSELGLQLPQKLILVHEITTDDPYGIEAYWHRRFKDKRKNGEWFDLSAEDVKTFKRRTFM